MNRENIYLIEGEKVFARLVEFSFNIHIEGTAIGACILPFLLEASHHRLSNRNWACWFLKVAKWVLEQFIIY